MAKDYLSLEEATAELGISEERVKALVAEGKAREYRDAGKIFYKRTELEDAEKGGSSIVDLSAAENSPEEVSLDDNESFASALSSLADSSMALGALDESPAPSSSLPSMGEDSGESISFADSEPETAKSQGGQASSGFDLADLPEDLPAEEVAGEDTFTSEIDLLPDDAREKSDAGAAPPPAPEPAALDEIPDLGLSGSSIISLEPSDSQVSKAPPKPAAKEDTHAMKPGISVFDDEEIEVETDPLGETQISSGVGDFDAVGGGSGLLDLTQESDDTSLGAELLDVISPTDATEVEVDALEADTITEDVPVAAYEDEHAIGATAAPTMAPAGVAVRRAPAGDMPGAVPLNVTMLLGILGMAMLGLAAAGAVQGVWPATIMDAISRGVVHWSVFGGAILISAVLGIVGILAGRK